MRLPTRRHIGVEVHPTTESAFTLVVFVALGFAAGMLLSPLRASAQESDGGPGAGNASTDTSDSGGSGDAGGADDEGPPVLPILGATTFSMTSTSDAQYRFDNFNRNPYDDDFLALGEKLELNLQGEELRLNARLDGFLPLLQSTCPAGMESLCTLEGDARPERLTAHYQHGDLTVDAGDSYAVLGRGIALSLRKVDLLGVDDALRGGQVQYDGYHFYFRVLGGLVNPQNLDPATLTIIHEPTDLVAGGEVGTRLGANQDIELGAHAVRVWFDKDPNTGQKATVTVVGWHFSVPALFDGRLALYGEADALRRDMSGGLTSASTRYGRAIYGSVQLEQGNTTVLAEWKDYRDFLVAANDVEPNAWRVYSAAPALEREEERYRDTYNARGGRVQVDYGFLPGPWSLSVVGILYGHNEDPAADPWDGILTEHGYLEVQRNNVALGAHQVGWSLDASAGYRQETYLSDPFSPQVHNGDLDWRVVHATVDVGVSFGRHAFDLRIDQRFEKRFKFDYVTYVRGGVTLTWSYAGKLTLSPALLWDSELTNRSPLYPGLEARYKFGDQGNLVRLFGGLTPGGLICSGGVCRDVPAFEGVQAEVVLRL